MQEPHLSDAARALIIERVIAGDSNRQINLALVAAKHIPTGRVISNNAITLYRQSSEARVSVRRLTHEAMQVGHAALSATILLNYRLISEYGQILLPDKGVPLVVDERHTLAERIVFKAMGNLWKYLWESALPETIAEETRLDQLASRLEHADSLPPEQRLMIVVEVRETLNRMLRSLVQDRNRLAAEPTMIASTPDENGADNA